MSRIIDYLRHKIVLAAPTCTLWQLFEWEVEGKPQFFYLFRPWEWWLNVLFWFHEEFHIRPSKMLFQTPQWAVVTREDIAWERDKRALVKVSPGRRAEVTFS